MRKNPAFLLGICLLLSLILAGIASAGDICTWGSPLAHWNLTLNGNDCSATAKHLTSVGAPIFSTNGTTFIGPGNYLTDTTEFAFGTNSFSACVNVSMSAYDGWYVGNTDSSADSGWGMASLLATAKLRIGLMIPTALYVYSTTSAPLGRFYEVCQVRNSTDFAMYVDGRFNNTGNPAGKDATPISGSFRIGNGEWDAGFYGTVRDATIYNYALSSKNVSDRYNKIWVEEVPPTPSIDTINISAPQPLDNTQFNALTLNFNLTANASQTFNCSFYTDAMLNQTQTGHSAGNNIFINFNMTFGATAEKNYTYYINCTTNDTSKKTEDATFFIDNVYPIVSVDGLLGSGSYFIFKGNMTGSINCSDTDLFSMNVSIDITTIFNTSDIDSTLFNYNLSYNPSNLSIGVHRIWVRCADGHTSNAISDWIYSKGMIDKSIKYEFDGGWIKLKPTNKGLFTLFDTQKKKDRYIWIYERDFIQKLLYGNDIEFEVSSSHPLSIPTKKNYEGWIISEAMNKWMDFESGEGNVILTRLTDKKINVLIRDIMSDPIVFNSIGDLNVVTKNYSFYYGNITETYITPKLETDTSLFTLNITKNSSYISDIAAYLYWNDTQYTPTKTTETNNIYFYYDLSIPQISYNTTNKLFYWNWTATGIINNETNATDIHNHSIYKMIITNCTGSGVVIDRTNITLNFTIRDEIDNHLVSPTTESSFTVWNTSTSSSRTYGYKYYGSSNPKFCIYPDWATLNTNYLVQFTAEGYNTRSYAKNAVTLNYVMENVTIYMATTTNTTQITIIIVGSGGESLPTIIVEAWRYNLVTNSYTLIETKTTDEDGIVKMNLYTTNREYQFRCYQAGNLVYTSSTMELFQTEYTFQIASAVPENVLATIKQRLTYSLTADKSTRNITLVWNEGGQELIDRVYLEIYSTNITNHTQLSVQTSSESSGVLSYVVPPQNTSYMGVFYVDATSTGETHLYIDSVSLVYKYVYFLFDKNESMIVAILYIGTLMFIGLVLSPEVGFILSILGFVAFQILGFIQIDLVAMMGMVVAFVIMVIKLGVRKI